MLLDKGGEKSTVYVWSFRRKRGEEKTIGPTAFHLVAVPDEPERESGPAEHERRPMGRDNRFIYCLPCVGRWYGTY